MTTLHPTPSRGTLRRTPRWLVVAAVVLAGVALIGAGLLLTGGDDEPAASPAPTCTPTAGAAKPPAKVTLNVYNATTRAGLAADTAEALETRSFTVDEVDNDPKKATVPGSAEVRYVGKSDVNARWVAAQVPGATVVKVSADGHVGAKVDLVIGEQFDALATTPVATAAFVASAPTPAC